MSKTIIEVEISEKQHQLMLEISAETAQTVDELIQEAIQNLIAESCKV